MSQAGPRGENVPLTPLLVTRGFVRPVGISVIRDSIPKMKYHVGLKTQDRCRLRHQSREGARLSQERIEDWKPAIELCMTKISRGLKVMEK
jgi:hypothetical protein